MHFSKLYYSLLLYLLHLRSIFPTTGIKLETAALVVFAVIPSTELLKLPSSETTPTKSVSTIPKIHIILDLKYFDNLSICTLSDILETIAKAVDISSNGKISTFIRFPINVIINNKIGSNNPTDVKLP